MFYISHIAFSPVSVHHNCQANCTMQPRITLIFMKRMPHILAHYNQKPVRSCTYTVYDLMLHICNCWAALVTLPIFGTDVPNKCTEGTEHSPVTMQPCNKTESQQVKDTWHVYTLVRISSVVQVDQMYRNMLSMHTGMCCQYV